MKSYIKRPEIQLLNLQTLDEASKLACQVFPNDQPDKSLAAIFEPYKYDKILTNGIFDRISWTWLEPINDGYKVAGIIGLYRHIEDYRNTLHIGWFAVDPDFRNRGIGTHLLIHAIAEVVSIDYIRRIRLDTTDEPELADANRLYEKYDFRVYKTEKKDGYTKIWRQFIVV